MCSELFRIPLHWGSAPIFGFGVALAIWVLVAAWALVQTSSVVGWPAALRAHLPTALIIAAGIIWGVPKMFPEGLPIRGYGVMVLAGSVAGILMAIHRAREANLPDDEILGFAVWLFLGGVIGARLFYIIEYWDQRIHQTDAWSTLVEALKFTEGGLVIYGAFFGAVVAFLIYTHRRKIPRLAFADVLAPSLLAGLCLGRIGCFLNGCCYGGETTLPWAVTFPQSSAPGTFTPPYMDQAAAGRFYGLRLTGPGATIDRVDADSPAAAAGLKSGDRIASINGELTRSLDAAHAELFGAFRDGKPLAIGLLGGESRRVAAIERPARSRPVHPAQLYSAIDAGLLTWLLWSFYPWRRCDGEVTALMLTLHPISRFLLEIIRVDESAVFGTGLSISQNLSIVIFAGGVLLWIWLLKKPPGKLAYPLPEPAPA